ncbi:MAG: FdtA/QdtA family cupin domain-containing protein [Betaproteobacteria bacterium]|nr:FdtA/QdtA family cupin domain-containing protein [Betaproteobacteria bacterium]
MLKKTIKFKELGDDQGWLVSLEAERNIPFPVRRVYYIYGTRAGVRRGRHAHRKLRQVLVCITGTCTILLDDGSSREDVCLTGNTEGLILEPMIWHEMFDFSPGCVLMVLADDWYDEGDYIRDYQTFKDLCR